MKYSTVLMALFGTIAAEELAHHHHHHYAPVAFAEGDGEAVAEAEAGPKKKSKSAKKSKKGSKSKGKGKKGKGKKGKGKKGSKSKGKSAKKAAKTYTPIVASGDNGTWTPADSRKNFEQHVSKAFDVVKNQEAFEAKQTSDIKKMNDKAASNARKLRNKVGAARNRQMAGEYPQHPFPTVKQWASPPAALAEMEEGAWGEPAAAPAAPKRGTPAFSYFEKANSLKAVRAAVSEQERFMAEHNAMVARNFAADDKAAKTLRAHVSRARATQLQGGMDY